MSEQRYGLWALATDDGLWDWDLETDTSTTPVGAWRCSANSTRRHHGQDVVRRRAP